MKYLIDFSINRFKIHLITLLKKQFIKKTIKHQNYHIIAYICDINRNTGDLLVYFHKNQK